MSHIAMQQTSSQQSAGGGSGSPLDIVLKHLDTVPNMIYGVLVIVIIAFHGQIGYTLASYADSALGRVLGISLVIAVTHFMGWSYGLLTALAILLIIHSSPRLAGIDGEGFEDLKRASAQGNHKWFVEKVLKEGGKGITTDDAATYPVQDDSEMSMSRSQH